MYVRTHGKNNKITKKELRNAARYMAGLLMSNRLCDNILVHIHSVDNLRNSSFPCRGCMRAIGTKKPPRKFNVYIDSLMGRREQLLALAHELTHVKQYAKAEVKELSNDKVKWLDEYHDDDIPYYFQPWEIESHGLERGLVEYYKAWKTQQTKMKRK